LVSGVTEYSLRLVQTTCRGRIGVHRVARGEHRLASDEDAASIDYLLPVRRQHDTPDGLSGVSKPEPEVTKLKRSLQQLASRIRL
jgi:hypothetical protein